MIQAAKLRAIIECETDDPRSLAIVAGGHPASFFRGANFDNADLRGIDLRGYNLHAATFNRVRIDRNTKVDAEFTQLLGLDKRFVVMGYFNPDIFLLLRILGIKLDSPDKNHLGDMIEEVVYGWKRRPISPNVRGGWGKVFDMDEDTWTETLISDLSLDKISFDTRKYLKNVPRSIKNSPFSSRAEFNFKKRSVHFSADLIDAERATQLGRRKNVRRSVAIPSHAMTELEELSVTYGMPMASLCNLLLMFFVQHLNISARQFTISSF